MNRRAGPHHRRSIRIKGYDYAQPGAYFITVCTYNHEFLFGEVANDEMRLNTFGHIVKSSWHDLSNHYSNLLLDAFTAMPNHVHGIIIITDVGVGAGLKPAPTNAIPTNTQAIKRPTERHGLPEVVRAFKTFSSRRINALRGTPGVPVWQRNYYEHVVRSEEALKRIREYIATNPLRWALDRENPDARGEDDFYRFLDLQGKFHISMRKGEGGDDPG